MSDLTDALEWLEAWSHDADSFRPIPIHRWPEIKELAAAARRVAEAPEVWWCEEHKIAEFDPADLGAGPFCTVEGEWGSLDPKNCRMVRKLLVDPAEET